MRSIRIGVPSGKIKIVLFEGTEDEQICEVKSLKRKPYALVSGVKYYLTQEEKEMASRLLDLI